MKEFSPKYLFEIVNSNGIKEIKIDLGKKEARVENRSDLYKLLLALELVTLQKNENQQICLDPEGAPLILYASDKVKFKNSFDSDSPNYLYPVVANVGYNDQWTIMGTISKAVPDPQKT